MDGPDPSNPFAVADRSCHISTGFGENGEPCYAILWVNDATGEVELPNSLITGLGLLEAAKQDLIERLANSDA